VVKSNTRVVISELSFILRFTTPSPTLGLVGDLFG
jgi:hypothetical protein